MKERGLALLMVVTGIIFPFLVFKYNWLHRDTLVVLAGLVISIGGAIFGFLVLFVSHGKPDRKKR